MKASSLESPDIDIDVAQTFGIESHIRVPAFSLASDFVPPIDSSYVFDPETTHAILAGFEYNRRVMIQGYHGTGKSTHIEQVAARLNWPCIRMNLDSQITRIDLVGRDTIKIQDGKQITEFQEGMLPWAMQNPVALVLDEYDSGRPDVMFVIQRLLESEGKMTLLEQNRVIKPHPFFRIFATTNTLGLGDVSGLYHGTQQLNQGQMDRWNIIVHLNYLEEAQEKSILLSRYPFLNDDKGRDLIHKMIQVATLTRIGFKEGDISTVMSPRTVMTWVENMQIFKNMEKAFLYTFLNRCDAEESLIIKEYYQRCIGCDL
jgi:cobaltochelatase CobS